MGNQVTVVVLEAIQHVRDGVVDRIVRAVVDIHKVRFLDHDRKLLHVSLIHSRNLSEQMHSLSVYDLHVEIRVGGCAVRYDEWTRASQVNEDSGRDERIFRINER